MFQLSNSYYEGPLGVSLSFVVANKFVLAGCWIFSDLVFHYSCSNSPCGPGHS